MLALRPADVFMHGAASEVEEAMSGCAFVVSTGLVCGKPEGHARHYNYNPRGGDLPTANCHAYVAPAPQPCPTACVRCGETEQSTMHGFHAGRHPRIPGCHAYVAIPPATPDAPVFTMPPGSTEVGSANVRLQQPSPPTQGAGDVLPCAGGCDHSPNDHIDMLVSSNAQLRASNAALTSEVAGLRERLGEATRLLEDAEGLLQNGVTGKRISAFLAAGAK